MHNRLTDRIHLKPFTLRECEDLVAERGLVLPRKQIIEAYMIFGGVPYYWTLLRRGEGLIQNIDRLCFAEGGALTSEFDQLYASLFRRPAGHLAVVTALGKKKVGMNREELIKVAKQEDSGALTKVLKELIACGFVRKYRIPGAKSKGAIYQLVDNFTLFYFRFMQDAESVGPDYWSTSHMTQPVKIWRGLAFERVCLEHVDAIKKALGVSGVRSQVYAWSFAAEAGGEERGAQIDLIIDRDDDVVNLCEVKFLSGEYEIDAEEVRKLEHRRETLIREAGIAKAIHLTVISVDGIRQNEYTDTIQNVITSNDLFA